MEGKSTKKNLVIEKFIKHRDLIEHFYNYYNFLELSIGQYNSIVLSIIEKIIEHFGKEQDFSKHLKEHINKYMFELIKEQLNNKDTIHSLINSFIDKRFDMTNTFENSLKNIQCLADFVAKLNIELDPDMMIKIIDKNQALKISLQNIHARYENEISQGTFFTVNENSILNQLLGIYCMLENIEIQTDEVELFKDAADMPDSVKTYLVEIGNIPMLSEDEKKVLPYKISQGDKKAMKRYVEANLRLVVSVAKNYQGYGLPLLDMIQEGNMGLMTAASQYDYTYGCKFSTYAMYWIKSFIFRGIANTGKIIRIPVHMHENIINYHKAVRELSSELNREPSMEEIAERMSLSVEDIKTISILKEGVLSLESPISEDNPSMTLQSSIASNDNFEEQIIDASLANGIRKLLNKAKLKDRELAIIKMRFGIDCEQKTLQEIGNMYGLSKERIRQLEKRALTRLRSCSVLPELIDYVEDQEEAMVIIKKGEKKKFYH